MKIGIITNAYEVPRIQSLLNYLKDKVEVSLYVEEDILLDYKKLTFHEDVFFTKGKGYILLTLANMAEDYGRTRGVHVVNDARSVWIAMHRFLHCVVSREAGVRVPEFSLGPSGSTNFGKTIAKNIIDQNHLRNLDILPRVGKNGMEVPSIKTGEEAGSDPRVPDYHFYQRFIETEYEYKIYGFGDRLLFYRQVPVLVNPNKMETRIPIEKIPELDRMARLAMKATGLRIASMDFLKENDEYYMTDINATPNFNYIPNGAEILGDYLLELARRGMRNEICGIRDEG